MVNPSPQQIRNWLTTLTDDDLRLSVRNEILSWILDGPDDPDLPILDDELRDLLEYVGENAAVHSYGLSKLREMLLAIPLFPFL